MERTLDLLGLIDVVCGRPAAAGGDLAAADAVLENAEQSFTIWPVNRALKFSDVVHCLAASEVLASSRGSRWIHADIKRVVASSIPHDL
jgi:hypothetical protein